MSTKARELAELSRTIIDTSDATAITINANEEVTLADDLFLADDKQLVMGDNSEFTLKHHNSGYGQIQNTGTLFIDAEAIDLRTDNSSISSALSLSATNAAVFSGSVTAASLTVTGALIANDVLTVIDGSTSAPSISNAGDSDTGIYFPANDQLGLLVGGSRKLHVTSSGVAIQNGTLTVNDAATFSGNVGIGVTSPSSYYSKNLVVMADGDGTGGITIAAPATDDNTYLAFADGTSGTAAYAGYVGYSHSSEYLFFGAGAATAMYIQSGNVGIGTSSPHSSGTSFTVLNLNGIKGGSLAFSRGTNSATKQWAIRTSDDEDLRFEYGSTLASEAMRIDGGTGKVVVGSIAGGADGTLAVKTNSSTHAIAIEEASGNEAYQLGVDSSGGLGFFNSGSTTPAVTFSDANKVGIGTSSIDSDSILHLKSIQPNIYFEDTDDSKSWRLEAGSVFKLQNVTTSSEVFRFDQSGHGGIGAAPDTTGFGGTFKYLGVNGGSGYGVFNGQTTSTTQNDAAVSFFGSTTGTSGYQLLGGMQVVNRASSSSNAEGGLVFYTATGGSLSERLRIDADGIKFHGDTAAANGLDDYEEGTWTPVLIAGTTNPTGGGAQSPVGAYTKIGNRVFVTFYVGRSYTNSPSGLIYISGLPFTILNSSQNNAFFNVTTYNIDFGSSGVPFGIPQQNTQTVAFYSMVSNAAWGGLEWQTHANGTIFISGQFSYIAA